VIVSDLAVIRFDIITARSDTQCVFILQSIRDVHSAIQMFRE